MNTLDAIFTRRSVRAYTDEPISDDALQTILRAAMSGPCCVNARDWVFIVVRDRERLCRMAEANGRPAEPLKTCSAAVIICGDLERAFPPAPDYWVIDGAIAGQNMCLAAHELGIGSVWLGTWPQMDRVQRQRELFDLPEHIVPHSILAFGYPAPQQPERRSNVGSFEPDRIHFEQW